MERVVVVHLHHRDPRSCACGVDVNRSARVGGILNHPADMSVMRRIMPPISLVLSYFFPHALLSTIGGVPHASVFVSSSLSLGLEYTRSPSHEEKRN